jgi:hypothetical protein
MTTTAENLSPFMGTRDLIRRSKPLGYLWSWNVDTDAWQWMTVPRLWGHTARSEVSFEDLSAQFILLTAIESERRSRPLVRLWAHTKSTSAS